MTRNGISIPILRMTDFFCGTSAAPLTSEFVIADALDTQGHNQIGFFARVHAQSIGTAGNFQFIIRGIAPSDEDLRDFVRTTDLGSSATIVTATPAPGVVELSSVISNFQYRLIRVVLKPTAPSSGNLYARLSAEIKFWTA